MSTESQEVSIASAMTTIQKIIIPDLTKGYNLEQVAERNNLPLVDVVREWRSYVSDRTEMSPEEQWVLQLIRLENLMTLVTSYVESTNAADPDSVKNLLGLFEQIEKLQNLNKSRMEEVRANIALLSEDQMRLIFRALMHMKGGLEQKIDAALERGKIKEIRSQLKDGYDEWYLNTAENALEVLEGEIVEH